MHDLLLAKDVLAETLAQAQKLKLKKISKVFVLLGHIEESHASHNHHSVHEITPANLKFNFNLLKKGTAAGDARLVIEHWHQTGWCLKNIYGTK